MQWCADPTGLSKINTHSITMTGRKQSVFKSISNTNVVGEAMYYALLALVQLLDDTPLI